MPSSGLYRGSGSNRAVSPPERSDGTTLQMWILEEPHEPQHLRSSQPEWALRVESADPKAGLRIILGVLTIRVRRDGTIDTQHHPSEGVTQEVTYRGASPFFRVRTHSTSGCGLAVRYQQLSWIRSQKLGNVLAPGSWVSGLVSCVLRASCPNSRGFDQSSETGLDLRELESILAACPAHRAPSPEDDMCRAQGGCPTKEGNKPWVIAPSQESRLAGRHELRRFNLPGVIGRVEDSDLEHGLDPEKWGHFEE